MYLEALFYSEQVKYAQQVKRYFDIFGRENVMIIIFDDFKKNTPKIYRNTLTFLNVDEGHSINFKIINPNKTVKSKKLQYLYTKQPKLVKYITQLITTKEQRLMLKRQLMKANIKYVNREPMSLELRERLIERYKPEVDKLSVLLDKDLSHWNRL